MNRGIARRPLFEGGRDVRVFLAAVARAVRRGHIEVHSWCVLTTHFHMLVRSPNAGLSVAMKQLQNDYVRQFNRSRFRDGSLVRGRFRSKLVTSDTYRRVLVRYIDANPVRAGLCADARDYRWCSARQYARRRGPPWLTREWVEHAFGVASSECGSGRYPQVLDETARERLASFVDRRIESRACRDDLDSLVDMAPPTVGAWLRSRSVLADGVAESAAGLTEAAVNEGIDGLAVHGGSWPIRTARKVVDGWRLMRVGLLRDVARASFVSIARQLQTTPVHARRLWQRHHGVLEEDGRYCRVAAEAVRHMLDDQFAAWGIKPRIGCRGAWHRTIISRT